MGGFEMKFVEIIPGLLEGKHYTYRYEGKLWSGEFFLRKISDKDLDSDLLTFLRRPFKTDETEIFDWVPNRYHLFIDTWEEVEEIN
jgi:hypothetical protein